MSLTQILYGRALIAHGMAIVPVRRSPRHEEKIGLSPVLEKISNGPPFSTENGQIFRFGRQIEIKTGILARRERRAARVGPSLARIAGLSRI